MVPKVNKQGFIINRINVAGIELQPAIFKRGLQPRQRFKTLAAVIQKPLLKS
jgi:hypothetical protein